MSVPPLSADQLRALRAWFASEPVIQTASLYGSRYSGRRRDPNKAAPPDIDIALTIPDAEEPNRKTHLVLLRQSWARVAVRHPELFGLNEAEADFVALRIAFKKSDIERFIRENSDEIYRRAC